MTTMMVKLTQGNVHSFKLEIQPFCLCLKTGFWGLFKKIFTAVSYLLLLHIDGVHLLVKHRTFTSV